MSAKPLKVPTFTVLPFDYSAVDAGAAEPARQAVGRIKAHERAAAVDIGRDLIAVKGRLGHGHVLAWVEAEFGWSRRTATNAMQVAHEFRDECEKIAHLPRSFQYQVCAPSGPQAVREVIYKQEPGAYIEPVQSKFTVREARKTERKVEAEARAKDPEKIARREKELTRQDAQIARDRAKAAAEQERQSQKADAAAQRIRAMLGDHLPEFRSLIGDLGSYGRIQVVQGLKVRDREAA